MTFRIFDGEVLVKYPSEMRGYQLLSVNGVPVQELFSRIDEIVTYLK